MVDIDQEEFEEEREDIQIADPKIREERTQSLMHAEVKFTTDSMLKFGFIKIIAKYQKAIGIIILGIFLFVLALLAVQSIFGGASEEELIEDMTNLWAAITTPIIAIFQFIILVLFEFPVTAYPVWAYVVSTFFFTWLFGRNKDVIAFMYIAKAKMVKIIMHARFYDSAGFQYIGGRATFMQRLFHGNPRYPFHSEYYHNAIHQAAELSIIEVAQGRNLEKQWGGTLLIIQTDPYDNVDDDEEVAQILLLHDEPIPGTEDEYTRTVKINAAKIINFVDLQGAIFGEQFKYKESYNVLKAELFDLQQRFDDLMVDSATKLARDLVAGKSTRSRIARGDDNPAEAAITEIEDRLRSRTEELSDRLG